MSSPATTVTSKGQVTIPKHIRDANNLGAGQKVVFDVNSDGEIVLRPSKPVKRKSRFAKVVGSADIHWPGGTDEIMVFLRGDD